MKSKSTTPTKPRKDFPLFPHARGYWAKKVRGRLRYFGNVANDPEGKAALDKWLRDKGALLAGREPHSVEPGAARLKDVLNGFLTHKKNLLTAGEISEWTFQEYHATCVRLVEAFGRERPVDDLVADDFQTLRTQIARKWGVHRLSNEIQRFSDVPSH